MNVTRRCIAPKRMRGSCGGSLRCSTVAHNARHPNATIGLPPNLMQCRRVLTQTVRDAPLQPLRSPLRAVDTIRGDEHA